MNGKQKILDFCLNDIPPIYFFIEKAIEATFTNISTMGGVYLSKQPLSNPSEFFELNCWEYQASNYILNEINFYITKQHSNNS